MHVTATLITTKWVHFWRFCAMIQQQFELIMVLGLHVHRQSLKYHPDKNKAKNAQSKFEEISHGMLSIPCAVYWGCSCPD
jgi:hypothetical protein